MSRLTRALCTYVCMNNDKEVETNFTLIKLVLRNCIFSVVPLAAYFVLEKRRITRESNNHRVNLGEACTSVMAAHIFNVRFPQKWRRRRIRRLRRIKILPSVRIKWLFLVLNLSLRLHLLSFYSLFICFRDDTFLLITLRERDDVYKRNTSLSSLLFDPVTKLETCT